ncbi:MAG: glycosyltransferase, partial [Anaerolineae bacterium]|nr:glycosyltransferase [Anaerolineae bacterium]
HERSQTAMKPTIEVLLLLSGLRIGGAEKQALLLAKHAHLCNLCCTLASTLSPDASVMVDGSGNVLHEAEAQGLRTATLDARAVVSPGAAARYLDLLRSLKPQVVYTYGSRADLIARPLTRFGGHPILINSIRSVDRTRTPLKVTWDRWSSGLVDMWVSNTHAGKELYVARERIPAQKIRVIPNGIMPVDLPPASSAGAIRAEWGIPEGGLVIGTVANLRAMKGHGDLIDSLPLILRDVPEVYLVLVGDGPERAALEQHAQLRGVEQHVVFAGHSRDVFGALAGMDIFVLASHFEGLPNALMEAMMARRPCISTDVGDAAVLLDHGRCGTIVPPKDSAAIAQAVLDLLHDPERAERMAAGARQRMLYDYSPEKMVERVYELVSELLL